MVVEELVSDPDPDAKVIGGKLSKLREKQFPPTIIDPTCCFEEWVAGEGGGGGEPGAEEPIPAFGAFDHSDLDQQERASKDRSL